MKTVRFRSSAIAWVDTYIREYGDYFFGLFTNTGIFSEATIRENYVREAKDRRDDLFNKVVERLSIPSVLGRTPSDTLLFAWKSKTVYLAWIDEWSHRIVTDIQIR